MSDTDMVQADDLLSVLDSSVVGEEESEVVSAIPPVTDLLAGEQAVARIAVSKHNIVRYKQVMSLITERAKALIEQEESKIFQAEEALEPFVTALVKKNVSLDPKSTKSIKFMTGKAGLRASTGSIEIDDMDKVANYCDEQDFIEVAIKKSVSKTDLKALMKARPEEFKRIKGVKFIKPKDKFYVST